jgi:hypothetical protein
MNVDMILNTFNKHKAEYILIGGMNFLLRHKPILTYDIDLWVRDTDKYLKKCEKALSALKVEWGRSDNDWGPVKKKKQGWLSAQDVFCMTSAYGAIDIFRCPVGLESWALCYKRSYKGVTGKDVHFRGLSDADMLKSQYALEKKYRDKKRIELLERSAQKRNNLS